MTVTFDVFSKKTRLYYIAEVISIVTLLVIAICGIFNVQFKTVFEPLFDALIIIGSLIMVSFAVIAGTGAVRTYIKDGELIFADDFLIIEGTKIPLNEAKSIKLKVGIWDRKRIGNMLSNRIEVIDSNGQAYKNRFVIKSYDNNEDFQKIQRQWYNAGVIFELHYHGT